MHQSSAELLKEHLHQNRLTPQKFARISGMPLTEVYGILKGRLPITKLRANHLAAAFNTKTDLWVDQQPANLLTSDQ